MKLWIVGIGVKMDAMVVQDGAKGEEADGEKEWTKD